MSDQQLQNRFEELDVGRILGDLDAEESREWQELSEMDACTADPSLEFVTAAIANEFAGQDHEPLPRHLVETLRADITKFTESSLESDNIVRPATWGQFFSSPQAGWAVAALCALLAIATFLSEAPEQPPKVVAVPPTKMSAEEAEARLREEAKDLIESNFDGLGGYDTMSGKVVWSDSRQEGYMTLTDLPANDPTKNQYQLWIVDPSRDDKPVDGGVFNIPAGLNSAVVPINNPLAVTNPQAFVITLEQPGGVVVSKQEVVVALAKTS